MGAFCLFNHKIQDLLAAIYTIFDGHIAGLLNVAWDKSTFYYSVFIY